MSTPRPPNLLEWLQRREELVKEVYRQLDSPRGPGRAPVGGPSLGEQVRRQMAQDATRVSPAPLAREPIPHTIGPAPEYTFGTPARKLDDFLRGRGTRDLSPARALLTGIYTSIADDPAGGLSIIDPSGPASGALRAAPIFATATRSTRGLSLTGSVSRAMSREVQILEHAPGFALRGHARAVEDKLQAMGPLDFDAAMQLDTDQLDEYAAFFDEWKARKAAPSPDAPPWQKLLRLEMGRVRKTAIDGRNAQRLDFYMDELARTDQPLADFLDGIRHWATGYGVPTSREAIQAIQRVRSVDDKVDMQRQVYEMLAAIGREPPNAPVLFRGVAPEGQSLQSRGPAGAWKSPEDFLKQVFQKDRADIRFSSFSDEYSEAADFAGNFPDGRWLIFELQKGSRSLPVMNITGPWYYQREWISAGRFRLTGVEDQPSTRTLIAKIIQEKVPDVRGISRSK